MTTRESRFILLLSLFVALILAVAAFDTGKFLVNRLDARTESVIRLDAAPAQPGKAVIWCLYGEINLLPPATIDWSISRIEPPRSIQVSPEGATVSVTCRNSTNFIGTVVVRQGDIQPEQAPAARPQPPRQREALGVA